MRFSAQRDRRPAKPKTESGTRSLTAGAMMQARQHLAQVERLVDRLRSLQVGQASMLNVLALGGAAVPALRDLLFERQPSGIFEARCHAAELLAALGAFDVLGAFLRQRRPGSDAVEAVGDDVVASAAARAISRHREDWVYQLLYALASTRPLNGVLAGLGAFRRAEAIPIFVSALAEDEVRLTAEEALRAFGAAAQTALLAAASQRAGQDIDESESLLRKRRAALALLLEIGPPAGAEAALRELAHDHDAKIARLASALA